MPERTTTASHNAPAAIQPSPSPTEIITACWRNANESARNFARTSFLAHLLRLSRHPLRQQPLLRRAKHAAEPQHAVAYRLCEAIRTLTQTTGSPIYKSARCSRPFVTKVHYMITITAKHRPQQLVRYLGSDLALEPQWVGAGAEILRIAGMPVNATDLIRATRDAVAPDGRTLLVRRLSPDRIVGYDFTCSPPKPVSIACDIARNAPSALRQSIQTVVRAIETAVLAHHRSIPHRRTGNVLAVPFVHHSSRDGDPHWHVHLLVLNATYDPHPHHNHWRQPNLRQVFRAIKAIKEIWFNALARILRIAGVPARLHPACGVAVDGIPTELQTRYQAGQRRLYREAQRRDPNLWTYSRTRRAGYLAALNYLTRPPKGSVQRRTLPTNEARRIKIRWQQSAEPASEHSRAIIASEHQERQALRAIIASSLPFRPTPAETLQAAAEAASKDRSLQPDALIRAAHKVAQLTAAPPPQQRKVPQQRLAALWAQELGLPSVPLLPYSRLTRRTSPGLSSAEKTQWLQDLPPAMAKNQQNDQGARADAEEQEGQRI